jgi:hypothetical protein
VSTRRIARSRRSSLLPLQNGVKQHANKIKITETIQTNRTFFV